MMRQAVSLRSSGTQRLVALSLVAGLHVLLLVALTSTGALPALLPAVVPATLILATPPRPPPPLPRIQPALSAPPPIAVAAPEIRLAAPAQAQPLTPRAITRAAPAAQAAGRFAAATDGGLGLDVAASGGGGLAARGSLAGFEAAVRARVLAAKRQPSLAWDRRNTCVVAYRVSVTRTGALAGFSIDPCGVPEINAAARAAIQGAGPFPPPPDLGAAASEVHGSLIFHP